MKTNTILTFLTTLCLSAAAQANSNGCNTDTPGWGSTLGTVTRGNERTVSGNGITQIWSDAVTAAHCDKATFNGGTEGDFNADCRSNPDHPGDVFSWCAVVRFKDELCPAPWRVPTKQDFVDLHKALGGTGEDGAGDIEPYFSVWGATYNGFSGASGTLGTHGTFSLYWAQTESSPTIGHKLHLFSSGLIYSHSGYDKNGGFSVRCVR